MAAFAKWTAMCCSMIIKLISEKVHIARDITPPPETRGACIYLVLLFRKEGELSSIAEMGYCSGISIWFSLASSAFIDALSKARYFYKESLALYFGQKNPFEKLIKKHSLNSPPQISIFIHGAHCMSLKKQNINAARSEHDVFCQSDTHNLDKINIQIRF